ncbi:hypothetical protein JCM8097_001848 [Rhodosporidiobolus ruineniae]
MLLIPLLWLAVLTPALGAALDRRQFVGGKLAILYDSNNDGKIWLNSKRASCGPYNVTLVGLNDPFTIDAVNASNHDQVLVPLGDGFPTGPTLFDPAIIPLHATYQLRMTDSQNNTVYSVKKRVEKGHPNNWGCKYVALYFLTIRQANRIASRRPTKWQNLQDNLSIGLGLGLSLGAPIWIAILCGIAIVVIGAVNLCIAGFKRVLRPPKPKDPERALAGAPIVVPPRRAAAVPVAVEVPRPALTRPALACMVNESDTSSINPPPSYRTAN